MSPFINLPTYVDALHNFDVTASDESTAKKSSAECIPEETSRGNMRVAFAYPIANEKKTAKRKATTAAVPEPKVKSSRRTGQTGPFLKVQCGIVSPVHKQARMVQAG